MGAVVAVIAVIFWFSAHTKPARKWADDVLSSKPEKGSRGGKGNGKGIPTRVVDVGRGRFAIKFGDYRVGYLVQRAGMWVALNLRGSEVLRAATKEEAARLYVQSIGGGESDASWLR